MSHLSSSSPLPLPTPLPPLHTVARPRAQALSTIDSVICLLAFLLFLLPARFLPSSSPRRTS
eukprot:3185781-Rhodomonas_salina.7